MVSVYIAHVENSFYNFRMVVARITFGLLAIAAFLESSNMRLNKRCDSNCCKLWMIRFLGSILSVVIWELSIELSLSPLIEACTHCTKLWSKVYVKQRLEDLVYFCDKAHTTIQTHH